MLWSKHRPKALRELNSKLLLLSENSKWFCQCAFCVHPHFVTFFSTSCLFSLADFLFHDYCTTTVVTTAHGKTRRVLASFEQRLDNLLYYRLRQNKLRSMSTTFMGNSAWKIIGREKKMTPIISFWNWSKPYCTL